MRPVPARHFHNSDIEKDGLLLGLRAPIGDADGWVVLLVASKPPAAVAHFLMACYAYYVEDDPILSDHTFDHVLTPAVRGLPAGSHPHQHLITAEHLEAGTGFDLKYPLSVIEAARAFRQRVELGRKRGRLKAKRR